MSIHVDIWLRGQDFATTQLIEGVAADPNAWTDQDVRSVLEGMLQAMHKLKHKSTESPPIALRGLSWIVNPYEDGGVVIAIEIGMGAAVAGPFHVDKTTLERRITRVLTGPQSGKSSTTIH